MPYEGYAEHLAQGDIFSLNLVAPYADDTVRIFRTDSGLHGSLVFEEGGPSGKVFDIDDLEQTLGKLPPGQKLIPFQDPEMVVVYADLLEYFVMASQTCDVSGVDSKPKPFVSVLPFTTLGNYFSRKKLPIGISEGGSTEVSTWMTILEFLTSKTGQDLGEFRENVFELPGKIRDLISNWDPPKKSGDREIRNRIRTLIRDCADPKKLYLYYLPFSKSLGVPEGFVDFCRLYTLKIETVQELKNKRIATMRSPFREQFAQKLSNYLARIATPLDLKPPEI